MTKTTAAQMDTRMGEAIRVETSFVEEDSKPGGRREDGELWGRNRRGGQLR